MTNPTLGANAPADLARAFRVLALADPFDALDALQLPISSHVVTDYAYRVRDIVVEYVRDHRGEIDADMVAKFLGDLPTAGADAETLFPYAHDRLSLAVALDLHFTPALELPAGVPVTLWSVAGALIDGVTVELEVWFFDLYTGEVDGYPEYMAELSADAMVDDRKAGSL